MCIRDSHGSEDKVKASNDVTPIQIIQHFSDTLATGVYIFERPLMLDEIVMAANPMQLSGLARRLVDDHLLENSAAREASVEASKTRVPFVTHLVQKKLVSPKDIANAASEEFGTPMLDITALDPEVIPRNLVDEKLIRANHAIPIFHRGNRLFVAVSDPTTVSYTHLTLPTIYSV